MKRAAAFYRAHADTIVHGCLAFILVGFALAMGVFALDDRPMSTVDEHVHYDYALKLDDGELVHRGSPYEQAVIDEWACGVGHEAGGLEYPCGDPRLDNYTLPAGEYTSGYIHYPTYFAVGEAFRWVLDQVGIDLGSLDAYRLFSAVTAVAGVLTCAAAAFALGLRRWHLVAATLVPSAATTILVLGTIVNPGSSAILSGALIGWAGIRWLQKGRGFVLLAAAVALASVTAVTNSLAAAPFIMIVVVALVARRFGWEPSGPWRPRWPEPVILSAIVVLPVFLWGRYISATATVSNDALYSFAAPTGKKQMLAGVVRELVSPHTPWAENDRLGTEIGAGVIPLALRSAAAGLPVWIGILVFAALVFVVLRLFAPAPEPVLTEPPAPRKYAPLWVLAGCLLAAVVLYAPGLRFTNSLTFGFDFPITSRYSIAFAPLLASVVLLMVPRKALAIVLALASATVFIGISVTAL